MNLHLKESHTKDCKGEQQYWCRETSSIPRCRSEEAESEIRTLRNLLVRMLESQGHKPSCGFTACTCGNAATWINSHFSRLSL